MKFIRCKLRVAWLSSRAGYTGYTWLSYGDGPIAEIVEMTGERCRVIYLGGTDATIEMSARNFLEAAQTDLSVDEFGVCRYTRNGGK